jgi:hypothetical protein
MNTVLPPDVSAPQEKIVWPNWAEYGPKEGERLQDVIVPAMGQLANKAGGVVSGVANVLIPPDQTQYQQQGPTSEGKPPNPSPFPGPAFKPASDSIDVAQQPSPNASVAAAVNGQKPLTAANDQDYRARLAKILQADRLARAVQAGEGGMSDALRLILTTGSAIRTGAPPVPQLRGDSAGEAMAGHSAMQMRALEDEENRDVRKSQIEANNAYRQDINGRHTQNKMAQAHAGFQKIAAVRNNALQSAKQIRSAIASGSQQGLRSIPILLQKAAGDSGNIAVSEQAANAGRVALYDRFKDQFTKLATGEMTDEWKRDVLALVDSYEKSNEEFLEETADNIALSYSYILGIDPQELKTRLIKPGSGGLLGRGASEPQPSGAEVKFKRQGRTYAIPSEEWEEYKRKYPDAEQI